jgi:hypothetical protein
MEIGRCGQKSDAAGQSRTPEMIEARERRPRREAQIDVLIAGLLAGESVGDSAGRAGMSQASGYEMLQRRDVQDRLADARSELVRQAASRAASLCTESIGILAELARTAESESVRRAAASDLISHARALKTDSDVDTRLNDIASEIDAILGAGPDV